MVRAYKAQSPADGNKSWIKRGRGYWKDRKDIGDAQKIAEHTARYEDRFLSPFVAAERGYVDEVIMPHSTRRRIARGLKMLRNKDLQNPWKKHDNIPL